MLDNDYNGRALLEYVDTDVKITVRAAYPERFLSYLTEEITWLVKDFWEGLRCNIMVSCVEPCGMNKPGNGLFEVQKTALLRFYYSEISKVCNQITKLSKLAKSNNTSVKASNCSRDNFSICIFS